ncbi:histidine utilization repressor [Hydrogenophaga sp. PAMC20947]|uniref:histidine utilization repressor n=1 Tax=Hydrogenophaga sp. PAMC20947 TaxID=2565558 RepID=UPI00109E24AE|nr:histidine utilization repressor [Hydrogenophaga sp. PAMC20947]QCB45849.1 histidine utilization repressor [Hydrogenophaga sp. PAMC20947]
MPNKTKPKPAAVVRRTKGPVKATKATKAKSEPTVSLHQRILSDIEQNILSGKWQPGHRIPSEHELADEYQCSRMTVNKVLTQLARASMVERRRKAGSFVLRSHSSSAVLEINDIRAEVLALSQPYRFELISHKKRRSLRADMAALGLDKAGPVLELCSLHFAGARPFCLEYRLINLTAVPQAAAEAFEDEPPGAWLVSHVPWTSAEHRIRAGASDDDMSALLQVAGGTPCLVVQRRTWTGASPVTFVRVTYPGVDHELIAHFSPTMDGKSSSR